MGWGGVLFCIIFFYVSLAARKGQLSQAKGQLKMPQERLRKLLLRLALTNTGGPSRDWPYVFSANFAAHPNLNTFQIGISPDAD